MFFAAGLVACGPHSNSVINVTPLIPEALYVDGDSRLVDQLTAPDTVIYKRLGADRVPLIQPDGTPITWGLFNSARGTCTVTCTPDGTQVTLDMTNLVPGGTYSHWASLVAPPGVRELGGLALIGASPFGARDGSEASLVASAGGVGQIGALVSPGPTNFSANGYKGVFPNCLLDSYSFIIISFFSITGQPLGEQLGSSDGYALQLNWFFDNGRATEP